MSAKYYAGQQYIYFFVLLITLGFSGWYYMRPSFMIHRLSPSVVEHLPDVIVSDLSLKQFNTQGQRVNYFHTPHLVHFPHRNLSKFTNPYITITPQKGNPWSIHADRGESENGAEKITLLNNVIMHQNASKNDKEKNIYTSEITYYPKKNWAETDKMIFFNEAGLQIKSLGMTADLNTQQIQLLQQVSSLYTQRDNHEIL